MVKLEKSKLTGDLNLKKYNDDKIFSLLSKDCFSKCYICERNDTDLNIEHIIPHRGDEVLKQNWDNLSLACTHCNLMKSYSYDNIINPFIDDPEEFIEISPNFKEQTIPYVDIKILKSTASSIQTKDLLMDIYSKVNTGRRKDYIPKLNEKMFDEVKNLESYIELYLGEQDDGIKLSTLNIIKKLVSTRSPFAAIKRSYLRSSLIEVDYDKN